MATIGGRGQILIGHAASRIKSPWVYNLAANKGLVPTGKQLKETQGRFASVGALSDHLKKQRIPSDSCLFLFLRHPATNESGIGKLVGQVDVDISKEGEDQIPVIEQALERIEFSRVYSSPLLRCRRLAEYLAQTRRVENTYVDNLMEIDYGIWAEQVLTRRKGGEESLEAQDPHNFEIFNKQPHLWQVKRSETFWTLQSRINDVIHKIAAVQRGECVCVVGHGWAIGTALTGIFGLHLAHLKRLPLGAPTAISAIKYSHTFKHELLLWANADHLSDDKTKVDVYFT